MTRRVGSSESYKTPFEQSKQIGDEVRELKRTGNFNKEEDHTHHHEKVEQQKIPVKNRNAVESSRKFKTNHHSGVWEFNKVEGRYMWSDTGSFVYESKGDIQKIHNPDALNLEGPVQFRPLSSKNLVPANHVDHR